MALLTMALLAMAACVKELVAAEWRLDLNPKTRDGQTPLHLAAAYGHNKLVQACYLVTTPSYRGKLVQVHSTYYGYTYYGYTYYGYTYYGKLVQVPHRPHLDQAYHGFMITSALLTSA